MGKIYKDDYGHELQFTIGKDLTDATVTKVRVKKPSGVELEWVCTVVTPAIDGVISYTTLYGDFNSDGLYKFQSYVEWSTNQHLKGETWGLKVYKKFE